MQYRDFKDGLRTSLLGLGCMRFPTTTEGKIDVPKAEEIIDLCYAGGVNYFDTAYLYHGGESEPVIGKALSKYPRDSYFLATKLPPWKVKCEQDVYDIFQDQLNRCGVDHFDFYLFHSLEPNSYKVYETGWVLPALERFREEGKIRYLGFSIHAKPELVEKFLDSYGGWDFAQMQLNYFDWDYLDAKTLYALLRTRNIPIVVMEPVRGGRLAALCPEADALLKAAAPKRSVASWAMRWAAGLPGVQTVLSGMSSAEQARDNLQTMSDFSPLSDPEREVLAEAVALLKSKIVIPCTKCNYCDGCPVGLDTPGLLETLNDYRVAESDWELQDALALPEEQWPKNCISCNACTEKCPQAIDIPAAMAELAEHLAVAKKM
ncbi:MAG: aldo/keto reductase [Firmicutes bacterium]|nr:aldo/keto reductase [Bacillota bacterium]